MKSVCFAIVTALLVSSGQMTFAAPEDHPQHDSFRDTRGQMQQRDRHDDRRAYERENFRSADHQTTEIRPPRGERGRANWKIGAPMPENYRFSDYVIDYTQYPRLSPPSRYQQWIKVDNRLVLINVLTNTILKVMPEPK